MEKKKNNYIATVKALGIILMVIGHSGCPEILNHFLYSFHMPLFFICSGYFFQEIYDKKTLKAFCLKRIKKLYLPYIKWSLSFIALHNIFLHFNIYNNLTNSITYTFHDYLKQIVKAVIMTDYELLIRPFWFIKELLFTSLIIAIISLCRNHIFPTVSNGKIFIIMFIITLISKYQNITLPIIGNCSVLFFSSVYFYAGILYRKYESIVPTTGYMTIATLSISLIGSLFFVGVMDMRYTTTSNLTPYFILSVSGIIFTFNISKKIDKMPISTYLYYIGNHTLPILALNLLALKVGNFLKIWIFNLPIEMLSSYTIIYDFNSYFWGIYSFIGISIPLIVNAIYYKSVQNIKFIIKFIGNTK